MYKQIMKLDGIYSSLLQANALLNATADYFDEGKPDPGNLLLRYEMYGQINATTRGIVIEQSEELKIAVSELLEMANSMRDMMQ